MPRKYSAKRELKDLLKNIADIHRHDAQALKKHYEVTLQALDAKYHKQKLAVLKDFGFEIKGEDHGQTV